jgi:hypothetical protein
MAVAEPAPSKSTKSNVVGSTKPRLLSVLMEGP